MKRRTFIKTTGAAGLSVVLPWEAATARARQSSAFPKEKTSDRMLFPRPHDGAEVEISPVGLAWLPCPSAGAYRVEIFDKSGGRLYRAAAGKEPVHCPDRVFPPGRYTWDVVALDGNGNEITRRGQRSFIITKDAAKLPWIEPKELLRRVPKGRPRILYPKSQLDGIRATLEAIIVNHADFLNFEPLKLKYG